MRLKIILFCSVMVGILSNPAKSTHMIGGEMYYECLNQFVGNYQFTVKLYRDCYTGVPPFDDPIFVSIYSEDSLGNYSLFIQLQLTLPPFDTLENTTYNYCLFSPPNICIEEAVYTGQYILPPGKYHFTYQRCCRNQGIVNLLNPSQVGFGFDISLPDTNLAVCNTSPSYISAPPTILCLDVPFEYDHSASEPDGDSLAYHLCAPQEYQTSVWGIMPNPSGPPSANYAVSYLSPYDSTYPIMAPIDSFKIDPVTGILTGTPTQIGRYVMAVCVSEYRDGVLLSRSTRDFQFNVDSCLDDPLIDFSWVADASDPCLINFNYLGNAAATYDWDFGVNSLTSDTSDLENPNYVFPASGLFVISLRINEDLICATSIDTLITVSGCPLVSVPKYDGINGISVYPNPGSGIFTLNLGEYYSQGNLNIQVLHVDGRQLFKNKITAPKADNNYTLDLRGVPIGIYLLKIETGEGIVTKRLVVL